MNKKKLTVLLILLIVATGFIFSNSLQNSEESNKASGFVLSIVEPIVELVFGEGAVDANYIVRKGAHMTEFFLLAAVVFAIVSEFKKIGKPVFGYGLFYVLSVAVTDEFIQSFSDRTSSVKDVLIDFSGALIGFSVMALGGSIIEKVKESRRGKANEDQN